MGRTVTKSIAIIGEGETEWFYFDSLRIACRYPFKVAPDFPQHSDINHILKLVESYLNKHTTLSYAYLIWTDYFSSHLKCSCISGQRKSITRRNMPERLCSWKRILARNFGFCSTSCLMWFGGDMRVTTNCFPNCRNICRGMKRRNGISYAPTSINT